MKNKLLDKKYGTDTGKIIGKGTNKSNNKGKNKGTYKGNDKIFSTFVIQLIVR